MHSKRSSWHEATRVVCASAVSPMLTLRKGRMRERTAVKLGSGCRLSRSMSNWKPPMWLKY
eukprot:4577463-Pleurochrysis_carterae.AAC.7